MSKTSKKSFKLLAVALVVALFASLMVGRSVNQKAAPPQKSPGIARGLLSVPTNMLIASGISPQVCNTSNLALYQGAIYDSTFTHDDTTTSSDCGSIKLPLSGPGPCPITGADLNGAQSGLLTTFTGGQPRGECPYQTGPAFYSAMIPVTGSTNYTFSAYYYSDPSVPYVGDTYFTVSSYTSSGTLIAPAGQHTSTDSVANSRTGIWEETLEWFTTPSTAAYVTVSPNRFFPSTGPVSNVWIDDLALYPGWVHREDDPIISKTFSGSTTSIDSLGNITVKRINGPTAGAMEPFFPTCIAPGPHTFQWYSDRGWNCIWSSNMLNYQSSSTWGTTNPMVMARAATSSYNPDGLRVMMDEDEAVRGHFGYEWKRASGASCPANWSGTDPDCGAYAAHDWYSTIKDELASALTNVVSHGLADTMLAVINDAEDKTSRRQRDRAVMALVDSTDRANNGGNRRWPIITNAGNPSIGRSYTKADFSPYTDLVGTYMVRNGPFEKMKHEQGMNVPVGYCQVQSGGYNYRALLYRCIAEGGKMFSLWSDNRNTNLALGGSQGVNLEYEPSYPDFPYMFAEANKLLPLIRTPLPTDWSVSSSNSNVRAWARSYNGVPYVILSNLVGSSQTTTLTFTGVTGSVTSLIDYGWATGVPDSGTTVKNSGGATTVTLPAAGNASAVGVGGGTLVLRATGATVASTTIPGATTTTSTTTTAPATTTTTTIPPSGTFDDFNSSITYSSGWSTYSGAGGDSRDYLGTLHESSTAGATYSFPFVGNSISLSGPKYNVGGQFSVSIDGGTPTTVSTYAASEGRLMDFGTFTTTPGNHILLVTVLGTKESSSSGYFVGIDRITVGGTELVYDWVYKTTQPTPPSTIAIGPSYAAMAGVRVDVTCTGTFPGVWWYRTADETGTMTVNVWTTSGTLLATESSTSVAAGPGWRYLAFTNPPSVTAGTQYIVGSHKPNGAYPYSTNGFTGRSLTSPGSCLTIPASSGNNSLYTYSSSATAFPTLSYADSEYFISPAFLETFTPPTTTTTSTTTTVPGTTTTSTTTSTTTTTTTAPTTTTTTPPGALELDDFSSSFLWSGVTGNPATGWKATSTGMTGYYSLSTHESLKAGATSTITVSATKVYLYGGRGPSTGRFTVKVDGVSISTSQCALAGNGYCDSYSASTQKHALLWTSATLLAKKHTITIRVLGTKNPLSSASSIIIDSFRYNDVGTTTTIAPSLLRWSEEFDSAITPSKGDRDSGGNRTFIRGLRQNDYWQDASMGYEDFAGTSWNANLWEGIPLSGTPGFPIEDSPVTANWSNWYGSAASNTSGGLSIPSSAGVQRTGWAVPTVGSTTYLLTVWGDAHVGATLQPFIRSHNSGSSYLVPAEKYPADTVDANGPLQPAAWTYGYATWKVTFSGSRSNLDLRFGASSNSVVIKKVTLTTVSGTGTQVINPFSVSSGVMTISLISTPSWAVPGIQSRMAGQGQGSSVPNRVGGFLMTDRDYINPVTGQPLTFKGGYFEMRARFPDAGSPRALGTFPAWWLYAAEESLNPLGKGAAEIDIWEGFGYASGSPLTATLHFNDNSMAEVFPPREVGTFSLDLTQWHTYGFEWRLSTDPGGAALRWYVDGVQVLSVTGSDASWFNTDMAMRFNISADAGWFTFPGSGATSASTADPYRYQIDYVRVYSAKPSTTVTTTTTIRPTPTTSPSVDCTKYNPVPQCNGRKPAPAAP